MRFKPVILTVCSLALVALSSAQCGDSDEQRTHFSAASVATALTADGVLYLEETRVHQPGTAMAEYRIWYSAALGRVKRETVRSGRVIRVELMSAVDLISLSTADRMVTRKPVDSDNSPETLALWFLRGWLEDARISRVDGQIQVVSLRRKEIEDGSEQPVGTLVEWTLIFDAKSFWPESATVRWDYPGCCDESDQSYFKDPQFLSLDTLPEEFFVDVMVSPRGNTY